MPRCVRNCVLVLITGLVATACNLLDSSWELKFGGAEGEKANDILITADGDFLIAGAHTPESGGRYNGWLVRVSHGGKILWETDLGADGFDSLTGVTVGSDIGFVTSGVSFSADGTQDSQAWVTKVDASGKPVWERRFGGDTMDGARDVVTSADGGYMVAAYQGDWETGRNTAWLIKLTPEGETEWEYLHDSNKSVEIQTLLPLEDGGVLAAGRISSRGAGRSDMWAARFSAQGEFLWDQTYGFSYEDGAYSVAITNDGGYVLAGQFESDSEFSDNTYIGVVGTDKEGNEKWRYVSQQAGFGRAYGVALTEDEEIVVVAETLPIDRRTKGEVKLLLLDGSGSFIAERDFIEPEGETVGEMVYQDGYVIFAGSIEPPGNAKPDLWVKKTRVPR